MTPERWQRISNIFASALRRDAGDRPAFLAEACAGDDELRHEIESLLASHDQAGSFIEGPTVAVAAAKLAAGENGPSLAGRSLAHYRVLSQLGAGGMGEVYLAEDTRLGRKVALKFLPEAFTRDAEWARRFRHEARTASSLNHPNILTVYEVGEHDGQSFIATEYVAGETLRARLAGTRPEMSEVLDIAAQVASALVAAHAAGIVHRDVKPENVMIRADGIVKVLDFGLAKLAGGEALEGLPEAPTRAQVNTDPGVLLGTVQYMSPEQARAKEVDARTDIWSLGVVLYEMVTGRPPFEGETTSDTVAALLKSEPPPLARFAPDAPAELRRIVTKALRKDREERYQSVKDMALDLKSLQRDVERMIEVEHTAPPNAEGNAAVTTTEPAVAGVHITDAAIHTTSSAEYLVSEIKRHKRGALLALAVLVIAAGAIWFGLSGRFGKREGLFATAFRNPRVTRIQSEGRASLVAISPDGKYMALITGPPGDRKLVVYQVATDSALQVASLSAKPSFSLVFSPDGNFLYYTMLSDPKGGFTLHLYRIPTLGGTPQKLIENVDSDVSFSPDGKRLAFIRTERSENSRDTNVIVLADADGQNLQPLPGSSQPKEFHYGALAWSPDGEKIVLALAENPGFASATKLVEFSVRNGTLRPLGGKQWLGVRSLFWLKDGSGLVFVGYEEDEGLGQIYAVAYPSGEMRRITNDADYYTGLALAAESQTMVAIKFDSTMSVSSFVPVTKELVQLTSGRVFLRGVTGLVETESGKIIYTQRDHAETNIYLADEMGKDAEKLTAGAKWNFFPTVSPDGRHIVFSSSRTGEMRIWRMDVNGENPSQLTTETGKGFIDIIPQVTADGNTVIFSRGDNPEDMKLMKVPLAGGAAQPLFTDDRLGYFPRTSPDGKLLAYVSYNPGTRKMPLVVVEFDGDSLGKQIGEFQWPVGLAYAWSPDGKSLTVESNNGGKNLMRLPLDNSKPTPITEFTSGRIQNFAWSRDGKKLYITRRIGEQDDVVLMRDGAK